MCDLTPMTPYIAELRAMRESATPSPATTTAYPLSGADQTLLDRVVAGDPSLGEAA